MNISNPRVKWSTDDAGMHAASTFNLSWQP